MKALTAQVEHTREVLDSRDSQKLVAAEMDISKGGDMIVTGLKLIRDDRLYRATDGTFAEYCERRWGMSYRHVNRLIQHDDVLKNIAEGLGTESVPKVKETAAREIADLAPEQQAAVVKKATENGQKPTAKALKAARETVAPKESKGEAVSEFFGGKISGGTGFDVAEIENAGKPRTAAKDSPVGKALEFVAKATRQVDEANAAYPDSRLHQKALDGLKTAHEALGAWRTK